MAKSFSEIEQNHPCFGRHGASTGRIHLPVCPGCNISCRFCERSLNDWENRPGVASKVLSPESAAEIVGKALEISPDIKVCGIAGPGDTLAGNGAFETFRLVEQKFPQLIKCMSTNGLLLSERADEVIRAGVDTLTVTVNAVSPEIEARLNDYIIYHGKKIWGIEGAEILIKNQIEGIKKIAAAGITVKVNTVLVPEINGGHIEQIARTVAEAGADIYNIIPLIPNAKLRDFAPPTCVEIENARKAAGQYIDLFLHCNHCRADAAGVPGKSEISHLLYSRSFRVQETFSHG
ncbi:radical SAM protein [Treponema sp.]|uniref:radical SAM protein n=1 Tax=Treponema sp. TaxID=166 RepID=UPI003F10EDC3